MRHGNHVTETAANNEAFLVCLKSGKLFPSRSKFIRLSFEFTRFYVISGKSLFVLHNIRLFKAELSCRWLSALDINY